MKINLNHSPVKQPEGTYRFGLNVITDNEHMSSLTNEPSNVLCENFDTSFAGEPVAIGRDKFVVFLIDNSIWTFDTVTCTKELVVQDECFNWDNTNVDIYPVTAEYRRVRGCEDIIYLYDGFNSDKFINLSRPEKQQTNGVFDCTKVEFNPCIVHSTIQTTINNSGGNLEYGSYNFAVEYLSSNEDSLFITPVDIEYTPIIESQRVEGGLNIETNLPDIGGKPKSNQSITLTVTNIPEDAVLARIVVFRTIISNGTTSDAHAIGEFIPVDGNTFTYTYRGFSPENGDFLVDRNEYLNRRVLYQSSYDALQVQGFNLRYNLKETVRDISNYQTFASKIKVKYITQQVSKDDPNIYLLNRTFLGGQIILPYIHYVYCDGTITQGFPLIGRPKVASDEEIIISPTTGLEVESWQYNDTSFIDSTPINGYNSSGELGYYEIDQNYVNPPNFCGEDYWGVDSNNNQILNNPVRLFVIPDRSKEPHEDGENIYPIGLYFDESTIEYPSDDIVSHYFSIACVESNIVSKGILLEAPLSFDTDNPDDLSLLGYYNANPFDPSSTNLDTHTYISPDYLVKRQNINGDYIHLEGEYSTVNNAFNQNTYNDVFHSSLPYNRIELTQQQYNVLDYTNFPNANENISITQSLSINARTAVENISNFSLSNPVQFIRSGSVFNNGNRFKYVSIKSDIVPITNIWSQRLRRITNSSINFSFNGDYFISEFKLDNIADTNITRRGILQTIINTDTEIDVAFETFEDWYMESTVNNFLRHNGTDNCNKNYQHVSNPFSLIFDKVTEPYETKLRLRDSICGFWGGYNLDYSYISQHNKYLSLRQTYDFCSECQGEYPTRIIFSQKSFDNDLIDNHRVFLPNNFVDLPSDTGALIKVDYRDNKLICRTERSCYFLQPNPQQLQTNETNVYIGTGDFLSIPPQELNISQPGYGGQQHKLDSLNFERGLIWSDRQRGEIYFMGGEFREIHQDLDQWFHNNLNNDDNHLIFTYDNEHERLLMTKLNNWTISYCFKSDGWKSWHSYIPQWYLYTTETFYSFYNNSLWGHNGHTYTTFYNINFPHVVEMIIGGEGITYIPQSIIYHSNVYDLSEGYDKDILDITYDKMIAYNNTQSTGIQDLVLNNKMNIYYNASTTYVMETDRNFKISHLKDLSTSSNIWSTDISQFKVGDQGYFDFSPIVDFTKSQVYQGDFRDKWLGVRLFFNNNELKSVFEYGDSLKLNSIR